MRKKKKTFLFVLLVPYLFFSNGIFAKDIAGEIREGLRNRIEAAGSPVNILIGEESVCAVEALPRFYEARAYQPVWVEKNKPNKRLTELIAAIQKAGDEGLRPEDYHLDTILKIMDAVEKKTTDTGDRLKRLIDLDLLSTDSFLVYGSHLICGRINPETIDPEWHANRRGNDLSAVLQKAVQEDDIGGTLQQLSPRQKGYDELKNALAFYRNIQKQGGFPMFPTGPKMQKGETGERVAALIKRLAVEYPGGGESSVPEAEFGITVEQKVIQFQNRHGLEPDGVVGNATITALNITPEEKIRRIEINMERWRWLPEDIGNRYILVNIADFKLDVAENDHSVMDMRVIVGKGYRRTPVFRDKITYLVLNPYWNVPPSIAVKDKLPLIQADPGYLAKQGMKMFQGWDSQTREIDPHTVDCTRLGPENFRYRLRQDPGPLNALGRIKFMFPNRYNVYLHDTPSRELFAKTVRTFSSGCIRIEKPLDLAVYLLKDDPKWTRKNISAALQRNTKQTVSVKPAIPIYLLYWTVLIDEEGFVRFREDIYGRDKRLVKAFYEKCIGHFDSKFSLGHISANNTMIN